MSKRVLFINGGFYPNSGPGSHRVVKMAKYLGRFGWTPVSLCPEFTPENSRGDYDAGLAALPDPCEVIRVPYYDMRWNLLTRAFFSRVECRFWPYRAPLMFSRQLEAAAMALAARGRFDAVWSSYSPGYAHYVSSRVATRFGIPWVADFRDLPDQTYDSRWIRRLVRAEVKVCAAASALTTVTQPLADRLAQRHRLPTYVIYNGFDPDDAPRAEATRSDLFTISYFGTLYAFRDPRPLFEAVDLLVSRGQVDAADVRVRFYVPDPNVVRSRLEGFRCGPMVEINGRVPVHEMRRLEQASVVLLLLKAREEGPSLPSKLFEYMAAGRPVLTVPGDGEMVDATLEETRVGVSGGSPEATAAILKAWYDVWKRTGWLPATAIPERLASYSRVVEAGQLAAILDQVSSRA